ncbi:unnamed protein product [Boreogadus saida]
MQSTSGSRSDTRIASRVSERDPDVLCMDSLRGRQQSRWFPVCAPKDLIDGGQYMLCDLSTRGVGPPKGISIAQKNVKEREKAKIDKRKGVSAPRTPTPKLHTDLDRGESEVKYTLSGDGAGSIFTIDQTTGDIHALRSLDREEKPYYTLRAQAVDMDTDRPLEPESEFVIKVQDINDNEPKFLEGPYTATVAEMSPVGTSVTQVTATDADDPTYGNSARVVYSILHGQPYFSVDPKTGEFMQTLCSGTESWAPGCSPTQPAAELTFRGRPCGPTDVHVSPLMTEHRTASRDPGLI